MKEHHVCKKSYFWNPDSCCCKNSKYSASVTDDFAIMCDEIIEEKKLFQQKQPQQSSPNKTVPTNFNEKKGNL